MQTLLVRVNEAAEALGLSRSKVYDLIARGEIPSVRVGNSVRVSTRALEAWLKALGTQACRSLPKAPHDGGRPAPPRLSGPRNQGIKRPSAQPRTPGALDRRRT